MAEQELSVEVLAEEYELLKRQYEEMEAVSPVPSFSYNVRPTYHHGVLPLQAYQLVSIQFLGWED